MPLQVTGHQPSPTHAEALRIGVLRIARSRRSAPRPSSITDNVVFTVFPSGNDMEDSRECWLSTVRRERRTKNKMNGAALRTRHHKVHQKNDPDSPGKGGSSPC